tara:strand:- start:1594 stop:2253 length:660 start_codon:yes stop_codon:yes gene_type:complete
MVKKRETVANLERLLQEKFGSGQSFRPSSRKFEAGVRALDDIGLEQGAVNEVVSEAASSGTGCLINGLLAASQEHQVALIDGRDCFDPESSEATDSSLLWVRCQRADEAMKAADILLRDGNLPLVLLDLQLNPAVETRRIAASSWYRLKALAHETDTTLLAFTSEKSIPCAAVRLLLRQQFSLSAFDHRRENVNLLPVLERTRQPALAAVDTPAFARTG